MRDGNASMANPRSAGIGSETVLKPCAVMSGSRAGPDVGDVGRAEKALQGLYEISKILASPGRLEAVLSSVLTALSRFVDMRRGLIVLIDDAGRATAAVGSGWGEGDAKAHFQSLPKSLATRLVATRRAFIVGDATKDPLLAGWPGAPWARGRSP